MRSMTERAHRFAEVAPPAQVPVGIHRLDAQRVDPPPLALTARVLIVELDLHTRSTEVRMVASVSSVSDACTATGVGLDEDPLGQLRHEGRRSPGRACSGSDERYWSPR